jgi:cellulose 1,4-beta-cellobiosidase
VQRAEEEPMSRRTVMKVQRDLWALCFAVLSAGCFDAPSRTVAPRPSAVSYEHEPALPFVDDPVSALPALPVASAITPYAQPTNPFENAAFFVNDDYARRVESTYEIEPAEVARLERVRTYPTGIWIDSTVRVERIARSLDAAERQSSARGQRVVPVFVLYDLPDRDCANKSATGEFLVAEGGERLYREQFVDVIAGLFRARPNQHSVVIVEPNALANLVTNMSVEKCARASIIQQHAIAYAVSKLSLPNVHVYLDAGHAGWLGWETHRDRLAQTVARVLELAGGAYRVRGFATNVANYNALTGDFGRRLEPSNPCVNELSYVEKLSESLSRVGIYYKGFIIDTGRNGAPEVRSRWEQWCNLTQAGLGERPRVAPAPGIDAYFWVKPPGESDGCSEPSAPGFDAFCRSPDSAVNAPKAGEWFSRHFLSLVKHANPPL